MISPKDIESLANLARIRLSDGEKDRLVKDIDSILAYVGQIKAAPIGDLKPEAGAVKNAMRDDATAPISEEDRLRILNEFPSREGDYLVVKKILGESQA